MNDHLKLFKRYTDNEDFGRWTPNTVFELAKGQGGAQ